MRMLLQSIYVGKCDQNKIVLERKKNEITTEQESFLVTATCLPTPFHPFLVFTASQHIFLILGLQHYDYEFARLLLFPFLLIKTIKKHKHALPITSALIYCWWFSCTLHLVRQHLHHDQSERTPRFIFTNLNCIPSCDVILRTTLKFILVFIYNHIWRVISKITCNESWIHLRLLK